MVQTVGAEAKIAGFLEGLGATVDAEFTRLSIVVATSITYML